MEYELKIRFESDVPLSKNYIRGVIYAEFPYLFIDKVRNVRCKTTTKKE